MTHCGLAVLAHGPHWPLCIVFGEGALENCGRFQTGVFVFSALSYRRSLRILDTRPSLPDVRSEISFSHAVGYLFLPLFWTRTCVSITMKELWGITNSKAFKSQANNPNMGGSL